jgi:preprotein translocase subunit YajC
MPFAPHAAPCNSILEGHHVGGAELLWLVLLAVAFWLLLIRPQRKRQLKMMETQRSVAVGDEVVTHAGFFGRVTAEVDDPEAGDCLMLEVAPGTEIKIARGAVLRVVTEPLPESTTESSDSTPDSTPGSTPEPPTGPDDDHRSI